MEEMIDLQWTGERYVPQLRGNIALEHLHRYAFAAELVEGKRVLDIASGEGYGSEMLARTAAFVTGVDIDEASILHAQKKYQKGNLTFKKGSCTAIPLPDDSVDVVISFETIEHVAEHEKMLSEIKRVLVSDGLLIISTPDKYQYADVPGYHNQFHVKELYKNEFESLLRAYFKNQKILGQKIIYGSNILEEAGENYFGGIYEFNKLLAQAEKIKQPFHPIYLIAVCSDAKLPEIHSTLCEQPVYETEAYQHISSQLQEKETQLRQKEEEFLQQKNAIFEKENLITQKDALLQEKENQLIKNKEAMMKLKNRRLVQLNMKIESLMQRIKAMLQRRLIAYRIGWSKLFDRQWYLEQNPDVKKAGVDPIMHYIHAGAAEGRDPSPLFNTNWYLNNNPDVAASGINPLYHYIQFGWRENRTISNNSKQPLHWYCENNPQVSIIILNFNKAQLTIECLKSIWEYTQGYYYEIIVVDNGSQLPEFELLSNFKGPYKLVRLEINRYFGEGNNIGAELAKGEFLVFMNNDVIVQQNWISPLIKAFSDYPDCGVSGPKFIYPNGVLQEAGALLDEAGNSIQLGKHQDPSDSQFNHNRIVDYVSAATLVLRKKIFEKVLGFDFIYEPAYYEDVDLCLKIGEIGLKTYYISESCVVHHEHATTADCKNRSMLNNIIETNQSKFVQRWKSYLKTKQHFVSIPFEAAVIKEEPPSQKPTAAIFSGYNIIPGGGEKYLLSTAEILIQLGYKVSLITLERFSYLRITKIAKILGINLQGLGITTLKETSKLPEFDVFIALGNEAAPPVDALGKRSFYCCQFPFPCAIKEIKRRSIWMDKYEAIIVYSDFVKRQLKAKLREYNLPSLPIKVIPPSIDMQHFNPRAVRRGILSVGRFFIGGHCKQQDFLIKAFKQLYEKGISTELHLVGSLHPEVQHRDYFLNCKKLAQGLPIYFYIDASPEILSRLYETSSVYWHAAGFKVNTALAPEKCEHFGISVVEAMSAGVIPLVVNNGGPSIIVQDGKNGFCYDSEKELIEITQNIMNRPEKELLETRKNAKIRAESFTIKSFKADLKNLLSN